MAESFPSSVGNGPVRSGFNVSSSHSDVQGRRMVRLEDWIQVDTKSSAYVVKTGVKVLLERYRLSNPREDPLVLQS
jgi:hypothetical protein